MTAPFVDSLRAWGRHLGDTRTELAIFLAGVALVLVLAEPLSMALLEAWAPGWHARLADIDRDARRWLLGGPPASIALAAGIVASWKRSVGRRRQ